MPDLEKKFKERMDDEIDNYKTTVLALIGFLNLFRFKDDTKTMDEEIFVFQGRRFITSEKNKISPNAEVTPDLAILLANKNGILAEVKHSWPSDRERWMADLQQLIRYDDDLRNWPTDSGKVHIHELVLLPHQSRGVAIREFLEEKIKSGAIAFERNVSLVEFNRSDQRRPFIFFRIQYGKIALRDDVNKRLKEGVPVPVEALMVPYEKCKLYDAKPPLPYLLQLIWGDIVMPAVSTLPDYKKLRKNGKISLDLTVDGVVNELADSCSFRNLETDTQHQPQIPQKSWIKDALDLLVKGKAGEWQDNQKEKIKIWFKKYDD